jgi:hypothetical protein
MSAIADDGPQKPIEVLFAVHDDFDTLDVFGPLEIFYHAKHDGQKEGGESVEFLRGSPILQTHALTTRSLSQRRASLQDHDRSCLQECQV